MNNPINVTRSSMPPIEEYVNEIQSIWDTCWLTNMGEKHITFEKSVTEYLGVEKIALFTNGHMALELAIQAMGLSGEVITTPFTFASTTHAIVRNGLTPVFCDIDPTFYTIDASKIEDLITEKTTAIIPVHVYGNICNVEEIDRIAKKYNLKVIYDAAHAFGVRYKGKGVCSFGDAAMLSFHATKVFHSIEGGAIAYHDDIYGRKLNRLKNFGIMNAEVVDEVGANAKMNEFQAAMGICNLRYIDEWIRKRERVFQRYQEHLGTIKGIHVLTQQRDVKPNYAYYPILINEKEFGASRNDVSDHLRNYDVITRKYFFPLTSKFDCYKGAFGKFDTPTADYVADRILTLPIYSELELNIVDMICAAILECRG